MLLQKVILLGDHQGARWKVKDADWGLWASKITDSTLESSNSATKLNDLEERIEQASTTVLGKTSSVPPLEIVFHEQSYSSLHSEWSLTFDHFRGESTFPAMSSPISVELSPILAALSQSLRGLGRCRSRNS